MLKTMLDRPVTVTMTLLVVMVLGIVSINRLPVSLIPDVDIPYITVQVTASDLSAREIDESISAPLRQQLIQLSSLEELRSESRDGVGTIRLTFQQGADIDYLFIEVNEKIDRSMGSLGDIDRPRVFKSSAVDIPAFYINMALKEESQVLDDEVDKELFPVSGDFSDMSAFASEVVTKRIEQLDEVAMVDVSGCIDPEILIIPDQQVLKSLSITESDFESYITAANIRLGSLSIRDGEYRYSVKFQSFADDKKDIEDIYFKAGDKLLQIKDVAQVIEHPSKRVGLARSDGKDAVTMAVIKQGDARMSSLKKSINGLMEQFENEYPDVSFTVTRDQTELLEYSINNLVGNIIAGIILACLIIFLFMQDFRSPALVALTIPTALIFSMLIFYIIGLTINIISLSGLLLGVGMMVDNTIILTDNITARWQRGEQLRDAVINGTKEVTGPMLSSVLTTCAVFIPLIFVNGIAGAMFYDEAMAVTVVLLSSYIVTITVIPVYYWQWYRKLPAFKPSPFLQRFSFEKITAFYEKGMKWFFRHRWTGLAVFAVSIAGIILCSSFMKRERLPEITYTDTILDIDWNDHISLEENTERTMEIEAAAKDYASQVTSLVGTQQFVLSHSGDQSVSETSIYFQCDEASRLEDMKAAILSFLAENYPESVRSFRASGNIFDMVFSSDEAELVARLRPISSTTVELKPLVSTVDAIAAAFPETALPEIPVKTDVLYVADPEMMALYDVGYQELVTVLRNALNSNALFEIVQGTQSLPVVLGLDTRDMERIISSSTVKKKEAEIPVSALMTQVYDADLKYVVSGQEGNYYPLELSVEENRPDGMMAKIRSAVNSKEDFDVSFSGSWFSNRDMTKELGVTLLIAVLLLYLILASQFESLVQPLIILSELVIDIFGALLVLWIFGVSINLMSMIGLIVISGIVINDSILKIDTINRLRKDDGLGLMEAITEAGKRRLKAIVMTSLTTILSVCPFLARGSMGDDLQYPMSLVIIAGMVVGTFVSIYLVPLLYYGIYHRKEENR